MLLAFPIAAWGAWRLLKVVGRLVDPLGLPRWLVVWGALTYALVPVTSGAWGEGRFGTVAVAALLPVARPRGAGLRRPRPRPPLARRLAYGAAARARHGLRARLLALRRPRRRGGPGRGRLHLPAPAARPRQLGAAGRAPWPPPRCCWRRGRCPLLTTGSAAGLLLDAGRLTVAGDLRRPADRPAQRRSAPRGGSGLVLGVLAFARADPRAPASRCWSAGWSPWPRRVSSGGARPRQLDLPAVDDPAEPRPLRRDPPGHRRRRRRARAPTPTCAGSPTHHPLWQRGLATALAVVGRRWCRSAAWSGGSPGPTTPLARDAEQASPPTWSRARCSAPSTACW